jgi:hypothetical protein
MPKEHAFQVIEEGKKLSECLLWRLQEEFYANAGLDAWDAIPFYPTSNAFIGEIYAELILRFIQDYADNLDWSEPFYILELAAGSGTFSFYVLKELQRKLQFFEKLKPLKLCYVMTDFADSIVDGWKVNRQLQPFIDDGILDFAVFRPEDANEFHLKGSNRLVVPGNIKNPVVAIANYFFDSIRQDQFQIKDHQLYETRVTFTRELNGIAHDSPVQLEQLTKTESFFPANPDYYEDPQLNRVLRYYTEIYENASILFPIGAFRCIQNLLCLSDQKLLLLAADKGFNRPDYMVGHKEQIYTPHHGAFSYMVNFDALAHYFRFSGGDALLDAGDTSILNVMAGSMLSGFTGTLEQTRYYFEEAVFRKESINGLNMIRRFVHPQRHDALSLLRASLSLIQLGNNDPLLFYECADIILEGIGGTLLVTDYRNLLTVMAGVRGNIFACDPRADYFNQLCRVYFNLRHYNDCSEVALESLRRLGPNISAFLHLAACYEAEGRAETALSYYQQAASLDPSSATIQGALTRLLKTV